MDWAILIVVYTSMFIAGAVIVVIHELGHSFAYLLLTKPESVEIFIGSYAHLNQSARFRIGKVNFNIKHKYYFIKSVGLCISSKLETNYKKRIIILLAGPVFTFLVIVFISLVIIFAANAHLSHNTNLLVTVSCCVFMFFSLLSLIGNLVPAKIKTPYRPNLDNDGKQIAFALRLKKAYTCYVEALEHNASGDIDQGISKLKQVSAAAPGTEKILRELYIACLQTAQYDDAERYMAELESTRELQTNDILNKGCLQSLTKRSDEAIATYQKVLKKDRNNLIALNNLAGELADKGAHEVVAHLLQKAIKLSPDFSYAYCTFGYSKLLQGLMSEAKLYIDKGLQLSPNSAEAHKVMGIYYLKLKDGRMADSSFNKAIELNKHIYMNDYAEEWKQLMEVNQD
jgi:tetratricopeptide (TPR) repeat protein